MLSDILVLDLETTVERITGRIDNSPYNPHNKIVSAHFGWLGWDDVDAYQHAVYHHIEQSQSDSTKSLREALRTAKVLVCHCLLYTSPSPRDRTRSRMPSSA